MKFLSFCSPILCSLLPIPSYAVIGSIDWYFETDNAIFSSPAVDDSGNLFFGSRDGIFYALDASGQERWRFEGASDWIDSSPALGANGDLYFGSWDNSLYALDQTTGALEWSFETGSLIIASPSIGDDGSIYFGSYDGILYALASDGSLRWSASLEAEIEASVAIGAEGRLYLGTVDGDFYAFSSDGVELWHYAVSTGLTADDHGIFGAAAIGADGTVYVGSRNGHLLALSAEGLLLWKFAAEDYVETTPVVDEDGNIYFAARDGYLYKVLPSGVSEWELLIGDVFYASPLLGDDGWVYQVAYAGNDLSSVFSVDPDGEIGGQLVLPLYNDASLNLTHQGDLLVGMFDGALYAISAETDLLATAPWPRFACDREQTGAFLSSEEALDAAILATFSTAERSGDVWFSVDWFGPFQGAYFPWINHSSHGWMWCIDSFDPAAWLYDVRLGWVFVSSSNPSFFYRDATSSWRYFLKGTSVYDGGRWMYDYGLNDWVVD